MSLVKTFMSFFMNHGEIQSDRGGNVGIYEICGTCSISCSEAEVEIILLPANGYLSPCNKFAVFYPQDNTSRALLLKVSKEDEADKKCTVKLSIPMGAPAFPIIIQAAATQQKIKFSIDEMVHGSVKDKNKESCPAIVKCLFPAP